MLFKSKVTDEQLIEAYKNTSSKTELLRYLGYNTRCTSLIIGFEKRLAKYGFFPKWKRNRRNLDAKEVLEKAVKISKSYADVVRKLHMKVNGSNFQKVKTAVQKFQIDCSHFTGKLWNKGLEIKKIEDVKSKRILKNRILKEKPNKCEKCGLSEWQNQKINLEILHIDGNQLNNSKNNLKLLCPNCHSCARQEIKNDSNKKKIQ